MLVSAAESVAETVVWLEQVVVGLLLEKKAAWTPVEVKCMEEAL